MKEEIDSHKLTLIHGNDSPRQNKDGSFEFLELIKADPKQNIIHMLVIKQYLEDYFKGFGLESYIDNYSTCYNAAALLAYLGITVFINVSSYSESKTRGGILFLSNNMTRYQRKSIITLLNEINDYKLIIMYFLGNEICYTHTFEKDGNKEEFKNLIESGLIEKKPKVKTCCLKNMPIVNMDDFYR